MQALIKRSAVFGIIFTIIFGTMLHFTYELTGCNTVVGYFAPINESVWEHLKLCFTSWLIYGITCYPALWHISSSYWLGIWSGCTCGNIFIIIFFYTYTGIIGHSILALDILSFFAACVIAAYIYYKTAIQPSMYKSNFLGILMLLITLLIFIYFTWFPPKLPLFTDPTLSISSKPICYEEA